MVNILTFAHEAGHNFGSTVMQPVLRNKNSLGNNVALAPDPNTLQHGWITSPHV